MKTPKDIIVLCGGHSNEREVSLVSGKQVADALRGGMWRPRLVDPADFPSITALLTELTASHPFIIFNALHGAAGEDGRIQAALELTGIPFTGSRSAASAIAMNKQVSHSLAKQAGLLNPATVSLRQPDAQSLAITEIGFPLVVKPNNGGSSVGVTVVKTPSELPAAIEAARQWDANVLLQQFVQGRELTVTILDQTPLPVVEIIPQNGWYDYQHKYTKGQTVYETPADISPTLAAELQKQALAIYQTMGCEGYARVDFRCDGEHCYFLEVNTLPGMTPLSLTPMAAAEAGYTFLELIETIINIAIRGDWTSPFEH